MLLHEDLVGADRFSASHLKFFSSALFMITKVIYSYVFFYLPSLYSLYMMISTLDDESYSGLPMTKQNFNTIHAISDSSHSIPRPLVRHDTHHVGSALT